MRVAVLGAGVVGLTTAWCLADDGHEVVVIDRGDGPAAGASRANGAQLSFSYVAPLAAPSVIAKLPALILERESPLRLYPQLDPQLWAWCARFLAACTKQQAAETTVRLLTLSFYSRRVLDDLLRREAIAFHHAHAGKLVVYSDAESLSGARAQLEFQKTLGCEQDLLDAEGCLAVEPALHHVRDRLVGGVFTRSDSAGDCKRFCDELAERIERRAPGSEFRFNTAIQGLEVAGKRVRAVRTDKGPVEADAVVLALGVGSRHLARSLGFDVPIYPLKGYSITVPIGRDDAAPRVSVTDSLHKIVYARLGDRLRAAGIADLAGHDESIDRTRLALLVERARATFPEAGDYADASPWAGLRPATPRGTPILGRSPLDNLFLNVGHGALGFTLAAGAARAVADIVGGRTPATPLNGLTLDSLA
ncbi:D-amino acid dehydrogenase [Azospirillum sp.]|uniref:D-amino acid dehydrogenase n=1 Tax=Azospirillum sp. TaxID=34012 RepID=UPI003D70E1C8